VTTVGLGIDAEILSTHETAPKASKTPAPSNSNQCHYCHETFEGAARAVKRGYHEKQKHREEWEANRSPVAKKAAKRTAKRVIPPKEPVTGPVAKAKRISAAETIATNIGRVARILNGMDEPLSRALVFSAPATGQAIDEFVAGTVVDRVVVQRFATISDKWERLGGVIAFPILVAVISRNPALFPVLENELRDATIDVLIANIPTLEKQKAREGKAIAALRKLGQIDERFATSTDPIGLILRDLFAFTETVEDAPNT